jgi:L-fucose isomerase-like protein
VSSTEALLKKADACADELDRRAACFDELVAALEAYVSDTGLTDRERKDKALAALANAKGKT